MLPCMDFLSNNLNINQKYLFFTTLFQNLFLLVRFYRYKIYIKLLFVEKLKVSIPHCHKVLLLFPSALTSH